MSVTIRPWHWSIAFMSCLAASLSWLVTASPFAPLAVAGSIIVLLVAIHRPLYACLGFVVLSLFRLHEAYPILMPFQLPLGFAILTAVALICNLLAGRVQAVWSAEIRIFSAFFILASVGSIFAMSPGISFDFWTDIYFKIALMTLALAWLPRTEEDFRLVARCIALSGMLVAAVAIGNKFAGTNLVEGTRITIGLAFRSTLSDPNDLAFLLLTSLSFSLALLTGRTGWVNGLIGLVCVPAIVLAIIYTQSRGAVLGVMAVLAVYSLSVVRSKMLLILIGVGAAIALYTAMGISERMSSAGYPSDGLDMSAMSRLRFWMGALKAVLARPLTGVGIANFPVFNYLQTGQFMTTHNSWLQVLAETGIPGLALFSLMIVSALRTSLRANRTLSVLHRRSSVQPVAFAIVAAIAGFCAAGSFLSQGFTWSIYVIVALAAAVGRYADEHARELTAEETPPLRNEFGGMALYRG